MKMVVFDNSEHNKIINELNEEFKNNFMKPKVLFSEYIEYEDREGATNFIPVIIGEKLSMSDLIKHVQSLTHEEDIKQAERKIGYIGRLSASGYTDCTEWIAFDTVKELADSLIDMYGDN